MSPITVAIPTYNNAKFLNRLLEVNLPLFEKKKISVCISNNDSTDNTDEVIRKWQNKYSFISSKKVARHVNFTKNTDFALSLAKTEYVWLMGDRYHVPEKTINYVLESINSTSNVDLYVINLERMVKNIPSRKYTNSESLLVDLGHLMTCVSTLIINKKVVKELDFNKFDSSGYAHFCSIFDFFNGRSINVLWSPEFSIHAINPQGIKRKNWSHDERALSQGCRNWVNSVFSLPSSYSYKSKLVCIKSFGVLSKLFTLRGISLMRLRGNLTYSNYVEYSKEIGIIIKYPKLIVMLMSIFPRSILKFLYGFLSLLPKKLTKRIGFINEND